NLLGLNIAGASVIVGVVIFFINKVVEKEPYRDSGLDFKAIGTDLKDGKIWLWSVLPLVMDGVSITIGKLFLPGYLEHVAARAGILVSFEVSMLSIFQLAFLALGEEIAWRAFFQRQLNKALPIIPVLLGSSLLFGLGHLQRGDAVIVTYDIFF